MSGQHSNPRYKNYRNRGHEHGRRVPSDISLERQRKHPTRGHHRPTCNPQRHTKKYLSRNDILLLARSTPNSVLACVNENEFGFLAAYEFRKFCDDCQMLKELVKILHLLMTVDDIKRIVPRTIARIFSPNAEYANFICKLDQLIKKMGIERIEHIRQENIQYLDCLANLGIKMMSLIPETSRGTFPFFSLKEAVDDLSKKTEVPNTLIENVKTLKTLYERSRKTSRDSIAGPSYQQVGDTRILPTLQELLSADPKLSHNIVRGSYRDWKHYLYVHYQLMREDFLKPLRRGVRHLHSGTEHKKREENVYVYKNVKLQEPVCLFSGVGFLLRFDESSLRNVKWDHSKRLMFGSLLCLSKDDFKTSVMFASVMKRDPKLLRDGFVTIKFEENISKLELSVQDTFTMVESMAYFEAYRHILCKLQEMSESVDTLPFKQYIINCNLQNIPLPSYAWQPKQLEFDLSSVLGCSANVIINEPTCWPSPSSTCLDESQMKALKLALTKEISVIQGPPGTGKTFLGLKVVEAYLQNRSIWDRNREAPILVICYTNHALDQFLEGIQKIIVAGKSPNIIRIGGRCKSVQLAGSVLKNKVDNYRDSQELSRPLLRKLNDAHIGMTETKNEIYHTLSPPNCRGNHLRSLSELKHVILVRHFECFQAMTDRDGQVIKKWLELCPSYTSSSKSSSSSFECAHSEVKKYIDVDDDAKYQEDSRITEGEDIELLDSAFANKMPEFNYVTQPVGKAKRRKIERERIHYKCMTTEEMCKVNDIFSLSRQQKWELYNYWEKKLAQKDLKLVKKCIDQYEEWCHRYSDGRREIDKEVLFGTDIVGMTTTGAAKHHHMLQKIHPKIVIFEEAAEIFESHIITSLPPSVQQLILIGDHQQLRPKPNSYELEVEYNLGISLFERLVKNDIEYVTLGVQHRMRPEISSLIHPCIYPELSDHLSVTHYEKIHGIAENVFMITHSNLERRKDSSDNTTHVNEFEADFMVALCHYLLKQGYKPGQITILTMYRGQLFEFKQKMVREIFDGVRVTVVDDFQGEENDIILLSLVRSNSDKKIGFLAESNRICVSLSRAMKGLYIIGNVDMLRDKNKTVWPNVIQTLEEKNCLHDSLPLYCQVHKNTKVWARNPEDFLKCPEGGCEKKCGTRLACGHACPRMCHPKDMNHDRYKCLKVCNRTLPCKHKCKHKCWECKKGCLPCSEKVEKVIPKCGHVGLMCCSSDPNLFRCTLPCEKTLPSCGHPCKNECSKPCTVNCQIRTRKELRCGHLGDGICSGVFKCSEPCDTLLDCGDSCTGTCDECHMERMHKRCSQTCGRQKYCGHTCDFPCASACPPCFKPCRNFCVHSQCPKKCYEPCTPCMEPCEWKCKHLKCTELCGEMCNRPPCNEPCEKVIKCGHPCIGLCGEKCPSLCRLCDKDEVCDIFFGTEDDENARFVELEDCSHIIEVTGLDKCVESPIDGSVKFSECPKCKTPIRTSLRYCNRVKKTLKDAEVIKRKEVEQQPSLKEKFLTLKSTTKGLDFMQKEMDILASSIEQHEHLHLWRSNAMLVQISIFGTIVRVFNILSGASSSTADKLKHQFSVCNISIIKRDLIAAKSFVSQEYLSKQQVSDVTCEVRRLSCASKLCDLLCRLPDMKLSVSHEATIAESIKTVHESGWRREKLSEDDENKIANVIEDMEKSYNLGLSERERVEIVKAIDLNKGHWFMCPNGHPYCIGECGGAMQTSKCPECGHVIGGQSHQLASGNVHAPEMDNSSYPAWSERANLNNFDIRDIH